jgi:hypothetical protein
MKGCCCCVDIYVSKYDVQAVETARDFFRGSQFFRRGEARRLTYKAAFKPFKTFFLVALYIQDKWIFA